MKILDMHLYDPRQRGEYQDPFLRVLVDEPVEELGEPIYDHRLSYEYRLISCGPFWAPEFRPDTALIHWYDLADYLSENEGGFTGYGTLNKLGLIPEQLFPVEVHIKSDEEVLDLAMPVTRLRRLMRKHVGSTEGVGGWNLRVDEEAALRGLLKWRLESSDPMCYGGATPRQARCSLDGIKTIVYKGTHLPLCRIHLSEHETRIRNARRTLANT